MSGGAFDNELSADVWRRKYRYAAAREATLADSWQRVADAVASVEGERQGGWARRFRAMLEDFRFLPAGRILASAGTASEATLFNCFVMGRIEDSIAGIFERLRESALTMQLGGGIGCDFSTLRPAGSRAAASGRTASGPVSFMHLWNAMCQALLSRGNRRGAMMGTLRADHPDILEFIDAKRVPGALTNFNLSVQVPDALLAAAASERDWELVFPGARPETVPAALLWRRIVDAAYDTAEPGLLFVDRINGSNNLHYRETITTTNPCGEVPLPPFGACNLGSINLAAHVDAPFSARARLDLEAIGRLARDAVRFLDNVIDLSRFPLPEQAAEARATRRIGLGVTGLADALIMLGLRYDSAAGRDAATAALARIRDEAYAASIDLARTKGGFPALDRDAFLAGPYAGRLPGAIRDGIAEHGIRNSHLLSIAPAGSISVLANNVSSGIEPVFAARMDRRVMSSGGETLCYSIADHACAAWSKRGTSGGGLPPAFVSAAEVAPEDHLLMAAALQPLVDNSISKTVNVDSGLTREDFGRIYRRAFELELKGCTVFRPNPTRGEVLSASPAGHETVHCCVPEREGD